MNTHHVLLCWTLAIAAASSLGIGVSAAVPPNWPQFRGPNSQGVAEHAKPPIEFGPDKAMLWKTPLPSGVSSPCISGDHVFLTAFDQERKQLETICLDRKTGKVLWRRDAPTNKIERVHEISSPANNTPATDGERVFVHYVTYGVVAYDFAGATAWSKPLPVSRADWSYGCGASPIVHDGALIVLIQRGKESHLNAMDCVDGEALWTTTEPSFGRGWATPVTWKDKLHSAVGVLSAGRFTVLDIQSGKPLWWFSGTPEQSCATPAAGEGMVFLTGTGYFGNKENIVKPPDFDELITKYDKNKDGRIGTDELPDSLLFVNRGGSGSAGNEPLAQTLKVGPDGKDRSFDREAWAKATTAVYQETLQDPGMKTAAFAIRTGGHGDATNTLAWSEPRGVPEVPSPLLYRGRLYYIKNGGLFTCRDPLSGKALYDERIGAEGGYYASPVAADGRIYVASDRGEITVLQSGDALKVLSRTDLKETLMATPAIVENALYVRTDQHLWAFAEARNDAAAEPPPPRGARRKISQADDLPRFSYPIEGTASALLTNAARFEPFARAVRADLDRLLSEYDIEDRATVRKMKQGQLALELLARNDEASLRLIHELRALEDKPGPKLLSGLFHETRIAALKNSEATTGNLEQTQKVFRELYAASLEALPWEVVESGLKANRGGVAVRNETFFLGIVQGQIEPGLKATGSISLDVALTLLGFRKAMELEIPFKDAGLAVMDSIIASHTLDKPDIWQARDWPLKADPALTPVVVAIWDSGVDLELFRDRQFINTRETLNGLDDDENGFVDDRHGLAYGLEADKEPDLLLPLGDTRARLPALKRLSKGSRDNWAAVDSPEASEYRKVRSGLSPDAFKSFSEETRLFSLYLHGTHVAGIAVAGNPFARILSARMTFDHRAIPRLPTEDWARKEATMYHEVVEYFKASKVRVVNMSWIFSQREIENQIEANGVERDAAKRAELAHRIFVIKRDALHAAIKDAPGILFVCSAGNSDEDNQFQEWVPSSFELPNLIVVGAVDQAGDRTRFTTFGRNVKVYANGSDVESLIPGGDRLKLSGTSMSSPQVANLAAKLIALKPSLAPQDVIALILQGTERGGNEGVPLLHPRKTGELATNQDLQPPVLGDPSR